MPKRYSPEIRKVVLKLWGGARNLDLIVKHYGQSLRKPRVTAFHS